MRRHSWSGAAVLAALSLAAIACSSDSSAPVETINESTGSSQIALSRLADTMTVDQSLQLTAIVPPTPGTIAPTVSWASSDESVAIVTKTGVLFALKSGRTTVTATARGYTASSSVTVRPGIRDIVFDSDSLAISLAQSVKIPYRVSDTDGNPVDLAKHTVEWISTDPNVAPLTGDATVTGRSIGRTSVLLKVDNKVGSTGVKVMSKPVASVFVTPSSASIQQGQTTQLTATTYDVNGDPITGRSVSWNSSNTSIATVSSSGLVTTLATGKVDITANAEGRKSTVPITVTAASGATIAVASVTVSMASTLVAGQSTQATATLKDANGNTLTGRSIVWTSSDPTIASVNETGYVTTLKGGNATITATSEGKSGSAALAVGIPVVTVAPVATVTLSLPTSINVGATAQSAVTLKDAQGNTLTGRTITFVSSDANIASVSPSGLVTALAGGSVTITASSEGKSASAVVTSVAPKPAVKTITLNANATTLNIGELTQVTATPKDANGNVITGLTITWTSSPTAVATVSSTGMAAGRSAGVAQIYAKTDTVTRSIAITVVDTTTAPSSTSPVPSATGSTYGGATAAALPQATVNTAYPTMTRQVRVAAGTNLQTAINAAQPGDELLLAPGATFIGNFTLPNKSGSGWIVIRTDLTDAAIGAPGTRMTPSRAGTLKLAKIQTPNVSPAVATDLSAHYYRFTGVEIGATSGAADVNYLVRFGDGTSAQNSPSLVANNLIIDRSWLHGNATLDLRRLVSFNSASSAVIDSWLSDSHSLNGDSQAIVGWNGPGPFLIENNYLESGHEVIVFGGSSSYISNQSPSDVTIRGNHVTRPVSWKGVWQIKNLIETKHVRRMLVEGNVIENNWADAQAGFAFVLKSENQNWDTPWTQSTDITIRYNKIRNTGNVFNLAANPSGAPAVSAGRMVITDNLIENVNVSPFNGDGHTLQLLGGLYDIVMMHNTVTSASSGNAFSVLLGSLPVVQRLVIHSNVLHHGAYGIKGGGTTEGTISLNTFAPGFLVTNNVIANGGSPSAYPANNAFTTLSGVGFVNLSGGDYHLSSSSPYLNMGYDSRILGADIDKVNASTAKAVVAP